jgi:hypothetical protein
MIRFNDIDRTVIDVNSITGYSKNDDSIGINLILSSTREKFVEYNSYETRNIDIELLDKIFDVISIEDEVEAKVEPEKTCEPVEEKYVTWDYVKQMATAIKVETSNGDLKQIWYKPIFGGYIYIADANDDTHIDAIIYDEDLFNSLRLKEVR